MAGSEIPQPKNVMSKDFKLAIFAVILIVSPLTSSCGGKGCTLIACGNTFTINFVRQSSWQAGTWDIVLEESDARVGSCTIELPESTSSSGTSCSGELRVDVSSDGSRIDFVYTYNDFTVGLTNPEGSFTRTVTLTIRRNGEQVTQSALEPDFERYYPNGPHCGEGCWQATVQYAF
jgi:hypothetical protein